MVAPIYRRAWPVAAGLAASAIVATSASAAPVDIAFTTELNFAPGETIGGGGLVSDVFAEAFGTAGNAFDATVRFSYDDALAPVAVSPIGGGTAGFYDDFITSLSIEIGSETVAADIAAANNAASGEAGFNPSIGLFNPELDNTSGNVDLPGSTQSANALVIADQAFSTNTVNGVTQSFFGDTAAFSVGGSTADEFTGTFATSFGDVSLTSVAYSGSSSPTTNLIDGILLADGANLFDPTQVLSFFVAVAFSVDGVVQSTALVGDTVTFIDPTIITDPPTPTDPGVSIVPIPGALPLLLSGLLLGALVGRRRAA